MRSRAALFIVFWSATATLAAQPAGRARSHIPQTQTRAAAASRSSTSFAWSVRKTENFRVCASRTQLEQAATLCEKLRTEYRHKWLGDASKTAWASKCEVVLHPTNASYLAHVGRSGVNSSGCSTIKVEDGRVMSRRIDVRVDAADLLQSALPHELTHVVLADAFADQSLPRWADEGIAVLADPQKKRMGRQLDLDDALAERRSFRVGELLTLEDYPTDSRIGIFYGQSGSVVQYLVSRSTPGQFVRFVQQAGARGYDAALRDSYKIDGVAELERLWLTSVGQAPPATEAAKGLAVRDAKSQSSSIAQLSAGK